MDGRNVFNRLLLIAGSLLVAASVPSCSPPAARLEEPPPAPQPTPTLTATPKPTPHPATGAQARALQLYPELGVRDSVMNKTFRELAAQKSERDPRMMTEPDWPLVLARHAADILAIAPVSDEAPPAPMAAPLATPAPRDNPLERGAYNKARSRSRYYYNGGWYYY